MANAYATLAQMDAEIGITDQLGAGNRQLALDAASRQIDKHCGLPHGFWQDATVTTREFYSDDSQTVCIPDGISTLTGLIVKSDTNDDGLFATTLTITTHFILQPVNAADAYPVQPWTDILVVNDNYWFTTSSYGRPNVQVTAKFGWPAIPDDVNKACLIQAVQLYKASDAVFGAIQLGDGFATRVGRGLNPMAESLLEGYCRPRVG